MPLEDCRRLLCSIFAEGVLIDDLMAKSLSSQGLKDGWSDPPVWNLSQEGHVDGDFDLRLKDKPSANVDTADFLRTPTKLNISLRERRAVQSVSFNLGIGSWIGIRSHRSSEQDCGCRCDFHRANVGLESWRVIDSSDDETHVRKKWNAVPSIYSSKEIGRSLY